MTEGLHEHLFMLSWSWREANLIYVARKCQAVLNTRRDHHAAVVDDSITEQSVPSHISNQILEVDAVGVVTKLCVKTHSLRFLKT